MRKHLIVAAAVLVVAAALLFWWRSPIGEPAPVIQVHATEIVVQNQTGSAWSDIEIWVNDQYRGLVPALQRGQVLNVPLHNLVAGYGQRFATGRQRVFGVLLTARASNGRPVRLTWGTVRRK